eukprot:389118-Hanusia_phi.AAC.3
MAPLLQARGKQGRHTNQKQTNKADSETMATIADEITRRRTRRAIYSSVTMNPPSPPLLSPLLLSLSAPPSPSSSPVPPWPSVE